MGKCFVIQPFDKGKYDKRFDDVFKPGIEDAGFDAYRVDQDPNVTIPVETIEAEITNSNACLVEITEDNPNVWFELGMALALGKDCVLICSDDRKTKYPFDVQHRKIIQYSTGSTSDYNDLKRKITERLIAINDKQEKFMNLPKNVVKDTMGLSQHEIVVMVSIGQNITNPNDTIDVSTIRGDMDNSGFTKIATTIAINSLLKMKYIESISLEDQNGYPYYVYSLTPDGMNWLMSNQDKLIMKKNSKKPLAKDDFTDDIPF